MRSKKTEFCEIGAKKSGFCEKWGLKSLDSVKNEGNKVGIM